jgi:hypothetical protein
MALMSLMVIRGHFGCFEVRGVRHVTPCRVSLSLFGSTVHGWPCSRCQVWIPAMWLEIADPEYALAHLEMKVRRVGCEMGQHSTSGMSFKSQWTWKTSRPMLYSSLVLSIHDAPITSRMRLSAASLGMVPEGKCVARVEGDTGIHMHSLSLARQWGQFGEGMGHRLGGYG